MSESGWQVGIDIGGTFTDLVALLPSTGDVRSIKVPTQRNDPVASIRAALAAADLSAEAVDDLVHGTTLVTNAIVEDRVEPVALVATAGFEDVLDIGRAGRQHLYRLDLPPRREAQVPPERRIALAERIDFTGAAVLTPDATAIDAVVMQAKAMRIESIAVSLLHAYANADHERAVGAALAKAFPFVSLSHQVNPETREFERTATTVLNASVMPIAARYLDRLQRDVTGARLHVMHSAGGMASPEAAAKRPLSMALSGPAGGISAAASVASSLDLEKALTFDMGGTTTDVCLILNGAAEISTDSKLAGRPVRQPMVAVESIGAGGGSLVTLGTGGLSIGPQSAGAEPGPAAYGRGGTLPTVTDANAVLGYLDPTRRLGGAISLDVAAAEAALAPLAARLGVGIVELALGVQRVANAAMVRALARVTVERGVDGRQCTLLAFGGAGPMHAVGLAREFGIAEIVVPRFSSGFSALGCIVADMSYTQQQSVRMLNIGWEAARFTALHDDMLATLMAPLHSHGHGADEIDVERTALVRYVGQSYAVEVPFAQPLDLERLGRDFRQRHHEIYGYATEEHWEMQSLRMRALVARRTTFAPLGIPGESAVPTSIAPCWFEPSAPHQTPRYDRDRLPTGTRIAGPAIVEDAWSTIVVPPGYTLNPDAMGHLWIREDAR
ncbi:hydantoinase/oxoprolinase family protein [uncultured Reyranella sp.]|uniref:hydantoinase/oxoprolinase family protein n=1 Tax=uncultured Reyranella sp. TaxID=735512 RepID=UPI0025ECCF6B|nr:hydantoinase/oxoprolinase family protein [uncultured Reyranella sp.]